MRFGRVLWQPLENEGTDQKIVLVEEGQDQTSNPAGKALAGDPHIGHLLNAIEQLLGERDALLETLQERDVLDEARLTKIRDAGNRAIGGKRYRFYEVRDLDEWA